MRFSDTKNKKMAAFVLSAAMIVSSLSFTEYAFAAETLPLEEVPAPTDVEEQTEETTFDLFKGFLDGDVQEDEPLSEEPIFYEEEEEAEDGLTSTQRNSINMLNYMSVLTQKINESKGNQLFLESVYSSLVNDIYPNSVDMRTQGQITSLMDTIEKYRMIAVKRERLKYIYEQNRAQALRQAIPNPIALLSAAQSGDMIRAAASVLYMAVDSVSSYNAATSQADLQFLQDGWELDDEESAELHDSTKNALTYMLSMVRDYDLPGDYALSAESVDGFVSWARKPQTQVVSKIAWLESHQSTYEAFGSYWLELATDYYDSGEFGKCLDAIHKYEEVSTRIFRKDIDYANALPMAIVSAKETMSSAEYIKTADSYCTAILTNIKDADWSLRYFTAQIYMDLYTLTKDQAYMEKAFRVAFDNVVILVEEQRTLNAAYLAPVQEETADKNASKREKKEVKEYNKQIKAERKISLPPVSEALYLNCDLLFAVADELGIPVEKKNQIDAILHESGKPLFLTKALDDRFWFGKEAGALNADEVNVTFDGEKLTLPATCVTDRSTVEVTISGAGVNSTINDWIVTNVKRPKNADCSEFIVYYDSENGEDYKYQDGQTVTIKVVPVAESPDQYLEFQYRVKASKVLGVFSKVEFERVIK